MVFTGIYPPPPPPTGAFKNLGFLITVHLMRFEGNDRGNQTVKIELKNINFSKNVQLKMYFQQTATLCYADRAICS